MARRSGFPPAPIPESGNPRRPPDANLRLEFVSDESSPGGVGKRGWRNNDEARMTNDKGSSNAQMTKERSDTFRHSDFVIHSCSRRISFQGLWPQPAARSSRHRRPSAQFPSPNASSSRSEE